MENNWNAMIVVLYRTRKLVQYPDWYCSFVCLVQINLSRLCNGTVAMVKWCMQLDKCTHCNVREAGYLCLLDFTQFCCSLYVNSEQMEALSRQIVELQRELKQERVKVKLYQTLFRQSQDELESLHVCVLKLFWSIISWLELSWCNVTLQITKSWCTLWDLRCKIGVTAFWHLNDSDMISWYSFSISIHGCSDILTIIWKVSCERDPFW